LETSRGSIALLSLRWDMKTRKKGSDNRLKVPVPVATGIAKSQGGSLEASRSAAHPGAPLNPRGKYSKAANHKAHI